MNHLKQWKKKVLVSLNKTKIYFIYLSLRIKSCVKKGTRGLCMYHKTF